MPSVTYTTHQPNSIQYSLIKVQHNSKDYSIPHHKRIGKISECGKIWPTLSLSQCHRQAQILTGSNPRRHLFLNGVLFKLTKKLYIHLFNQFYFISIFKKCTTQCSHWNVLCTKNILMLNDYIVNWRIFL